MSSLLGDRIYSIHCRASYVAPGPGGFEERDALILFFILSWCNSSYSSFRPGAIHPNSSNRPCFKKVSGAKKLIDSAPPQDTATTFAVSSVQYESFVYGWG